MTRVDVRGSALSEARQAAHVDFAVPGAEFAAALPGSIARRVVRPMVPIAAQ